MKVSIITVCYNSEKYLKECIESVLRQTFTNIEYIVVDGGSSDNSVSIIQSYGNKVDKWLSEPDEGIYDAMNKGISLSSGDIIGFLNSDDIYADNSVISTVVDSFIADDPLIVFGDLYYVSQKDTNDKRRKWTSGPYKPGAFSKGWHPPHPTFFAKKSVYTAYGHFNLEFKLASDFELMLRFLEKFRCRSYYIQKPLILMRLGGTTNKNIKNILLQNVECYKAFKHNELRVSILYPFMRLLPKIFQYIAK